MSPGHTNVFPLPPVQAASPTIRPGVNPQASCPCGTIYVSQAGRDSNPHCLRTVLETAASLSATDLCDLHCIRSLSVCQAS